MAPPGALRPGVRPSRARIRLAVALWLLFAAVLWNVIFDAYVRGGGVEYLTLQALHEKGQGPYVRIDDVMVPAVYHGMAIASAWAAAAAVIGLALVALAVWRRSPNERDIAA